MKVLLADPHSYGGVGGGQTVYQNLFAHQENIQLTVLTKKNRLPQGNVTFLTLKRILDRGKISKIKKINPLMNHDDLRDFIAAKQIAETIENRYFDIIELPDYTPHARFLPAALESCGVKYGKIVLSLHGRISETLSYEWDFLSEERQHVLENCKREEDECYACVDLRYGISEYYKNILQKNNDLPVYLVSPFSCISMPNFSGFSECLTGGPACAFVGRLERRKGSEQFLRLLSDFNINVKGEVLPSIKIIGQDRWTNDGWVSKKLQNFAYRRGIFPEFLHNLTSDDLYKSVYSLPNIFILPSMFDTFNLVALEALLHGHPILVTEKMGVTSFLEEQFNEIRECWQILDIDSYPKSYTMIEHFIKHYSECRKNLIQYFLKNPPIAQKNELERIYEKPSVYDKNMRRNLFDRYETIARSFDIRFSEKKFCFYFLKKPMTIIKRIIKSVKSNLRKLEQNFRRKRRFISYSKKLIVLNKIIIHDETAVKNKIDEIHKLFHKYPYIDYSKKYFELAVLNGKNLNNTLLSAAYYLRYMRLANEDRLNILPQVVDYLKINNMPEEAKVADLLYHDCSADKIYDYLKDRFEKLKRPIDNANCQKDEHRNNAAPRVSIVVSLYNPSEPALKKFLNEVGHFEMVESGEAEIILVDSGSTSENIQEIVKNSSIFVKSNYLILRTENRETIQSAWNRGIIETRAPYLVFLGCDETLALRALNILADELDSNPDVNWVMSDSIVTTVDEEGKYVSDVMKYDRKGWKKPCQLFDCTYLSYVGGMYRKNLHDKYGYYDPTFNGAGDTEFKLRLYPYLKTKHIPLPLGTFLNYPAERTTASYRIEIEDLRAWYIFKSVGGFKYLFENASEAELEEAFWIMLSNRRCYTYNTESDIRSAQNILKLIEEKYPNSHLLKLKNRLNDVIVQLINHNFFYNPSFKGKLQFNTSRKTSKKFFASLNKMHDKKVQFPTDYTSDAFFFAHGWLW